jgi:hypothetical protein
MAEGLMTYAKGTKVSISNTEAEIKKLLRKYGAENFAIGEGKGRAQVAFEIEDRRIIIRMPLPPRDDPRFTMTKRQVGNRGKRLVDVPRRPESAADLWEQAGREKWRALLLCIKAKLEGVESGVETIEQAFFAHLVLPSGETMSEWAERAEVREQLRAGKMPPLLGGPS